MQTVVQRSRARCVQWGQKVEDVDQNKLRLDSCQLAGIKIHSHMALSLFTDFRTVWKELCLSTPLPRTCKHGSQSLQSGPVLDFCRESRRTSDSLPITFRFLLLDVRQMADVPPLIPFILEPLPYPKVLNAFFLTMLKLTQYCQTGSKVLDDSKVSWFVHFTSFGVISWHRMLTVKVSSSRVDSPAPQ
ncbi:hypothetical protein E5288_WYG022015 [Bos mutus]|uniref:Uncharacterized protein n=1 Tax=Bos mutus TaxID=72004 RepID=A0A6B0S2C4_9CETA|nr:hypothetical protein [Bos mutus]